MAREVVEGLRGVEAALNALPAAVGARTVRTAGRRALEPLRQAAAARAPRGRTGRLAGGMTTRSVRDRDAVTLAVGPAREAYYGLMQEFGRQGYPNVRNAAQPFLRPAWDAHQRGTLDTLGRELWAAIRRAVKRRGRG